MLKSVLFLGSTIVCVTAYYTVNVTLPDDAKTLINDCYERAKQQREDMQWQGDLACLSAYFSNLPPNNMTEEDWKLFRDAQNEQFGFRPPRSGFRIRKEVRTLTDAEWKDVKNVFVTMYRSGTLNTFGRLHGLAINTAHRGAAFLVWHRVFLTHFEEEMRKINPNVSLPYWDYTMDNNITKPTDSVVWTKCFFGENNDTIGFGDFQNFSGAHGAYITRNAHSDCNTRLINKIDIQNVKAQCYFKNITTGTEHKFANPNNLEVLHNGVHNWVGGDMGIVTDSAYDPIFWMHHAFIDYIFEQFRQHQKQGCGNVDIEHDYRPLNDLCRYCTDGNTHGHGPDDPMWGYSHLRNIDGLWLNWTTVFYSYDPAPSCPDRCSGKYLYCDKNADPRYPEGLCLTNTLEACISNGTRKRRQTAEAVSLEPRFSCQTGERFEGFQGDGRTRLMTNEQAAAILEEEIRGTDSKLQVASTAAVVSEIPVVSVEGVFIGIGIGVTVSVLVVVIYVMIQKRRKGGSASM